MNATSTPDFEAAGAFRKRIWIQQLRPQVDGGNFDAKADVGQAIVVSCDLVADGHDLLAGEVRYRAEAAPGSAPGSNDWQCVPLVMRFPGLWEGSFQAAAVGRWEFVVEAWVDRYGTWQSQTEKRVAAGQDIAIELLVGAELLRQAAGRAREPAAGVLRQVAALLADATRPASERWHAVQSSHADLAREHADRSGSTTSDVLRIRVDPALARFGAWYELFPRSAGAEGQHGTFRDVEARLPSIQAMGFDVLYLPPIHPIGTRFRKGKDNRETSNPGDPGSPWAIGSAEGGHTAVNPALGTLEDFSHLASEARARGLEIALDIAFQASADHPWIQQHPTWFKHRPDGSIQYAENPPKKYQDIYPFDFDTVDRQALWDALLGIFLFWIDKGVRVFRVDNPHTKPLPFWRWCLSQVKAHCPEAIFLAEAFTRPGVMYALAKLGFSQSYTYFTWRQSKQELSDYLRELTRPPVVDFFRPNFWPNTPDILPEHLQSGERASFIARLVLAGTLSSNYGIYGPVFELMEHAARPTAPGSPGSEEYAHSEKYELRHFDVDAPQSLADVIARLNRVRRGHPALQQTARLAFHSIDNPRLLAYSKTDRDGDDTVLMVVNLDPRAPQSGVLHLDLGAVALERNQPLLAHEELSDRREIWNTPDQTVTIDPGILPAAIFHLRRRVRSERDFEYYA